MTLCPLLVGTIATVYGWHSRAECLTVTRHGRGETPQRLYLRPASLRPAHTISGLVQSVQASQLARRGEIVHYAGGDSEHDLVFLALVTLP